MGGFSMSIEHHDNTYYQKLSNKLAAIGIQLSAEKNMDAMLNTILDESMSITSSDAGSIYITEGNCLVFSIAKSNSRDIPFKSFKLPIDTRSIAGSCAFYKSSYVFNTMAELPQKLGINHNTSFDESIHYKTMNMLVIPLKNLKDEVLGVMQLINKKRDPLVILKETESFKAHIVPYSSEEEHMIASLASQAAILIERNVLYEEIKHLFTAFIESMVTTIDQRDPVTAGHSIRVASYAVALAKAISESKALPFAAITFTEEDIEQIYYAGLLHDIGKIGIRENILLKCNKLSDAELETILYRLRFILKDIEVKKLMQRASDSDLFLESKLPDFMESIQQINQKGFLDDASLAQLTEFGLQVYSPMDGASIPLLTESEFGYLSVRKGNLTTEERKFMENHALMTYEAIKDIPWSANLSQVPLIARSHHEKLDGTGYPYQMTAIGLPLEAKILTIVDIFDALTARDRPYKPAMPLDKTLSILQEEAELNHIDSNILDVFIDSACYEPIYHSSNSKGANDQ